MLDMVLLIEGILGVCRTYCRQKKTKKIIITLHLSLLVVLHTVLFLVQVYHLLPDNEYNQLNIIHCGFATSAYLTYMSAVITAIWYDKAYTSYDESINRLFKKFKDEKKLSDADKKAYWVFLFMIILAISFAGFRSIELNTLIPRAHPLAKASIIMSLCVLRVTIVFEYLMFFIANMTLITFCKYQNSLISAAQKRLKFDVKCDIKKEEIQDWVDQYRDLVNCCQMVTKFCGGQVCIPERCFFYTIRRFIMPINIIQSFIFLFQFLFSLVASMVHYVLMTYQFFYMKAINVSILLKKLCLKNNTLFCSDFHFV